ncbi:MAG: iron-sulfur cluster carrier protein ApbC [Gammaproteobacteria bacterium]|nr:iron-sulfur cluster carrier protein ApbC [Gammaproteobacteria bacterium]
MFFRKTAIAEADVRSALCQYRDRYLATDLDSAQALKSLRISGATVELELVLGFPFAGHEAALRQGLEACLMAVPGVERVNIGLRQQIAAHAIKGGAKPIPGVKNILAVASGKGGVGKSTTAANLALALAAEGARVGVLDADIYGPSQPILLGVAGQRPESRDQKSIQPVMAHGLQTMSIGYLVDEDQAMIWRGPMVSSALQQLLNDTRWDELDYLIVDLPPGTGDAHLTLAQKVPVTAAIIVTTPQDLALADARKGIAMFQKVSVPVLGIVENMALHTCSACGHVEHIFGIGGGAKLAEGYGVELLGSLPLALSIREQADGGCPTVAAEPESATAMLYRDIARRAAAKLSLEAKNFAQSFPTIAITNT